MTASAVSRRRWTYGMQLPIQTLSATTADEWEHAATVADLVRVARRAEATGHDFVGVCDHVAVPDVAAAGHMSTTWYDPVATLGFLAGCTTTVRLLSVVWVVPYRHPLQTAKSFATLDHLSGGRAILGVGAGHLEAEFAAMGVPFRDRGARLDEALEAIRHAFDSEYVSFEGSYFRYDSVAVAPRPVRGTLPVWVGGSGRPAWRRAGRAGDAYIPMAAPVRDYPMITDAVREAAVAAGRAEDAVAVGYMPPSAHLTGRPRPDVDDVVGPCELVDLLGSALDGGATVMHVRFRGASIEDYLDQLDAFAEWIVPAVG